MIGRLVATLVVANLIITTLGLVLVGCAGIVVIRNTALNAACCAKHLHLVGTNLCGITLYAILVGVFTGAKATFDIDLATFTQVLRRNFTEFIKQ